MKKEESLFALLCPVALRGVTVVAAVRGCITEPLSPENSAASPGFTIVIPIFAYPQQEISISDLRIVWFFSECPWEFPIILRIMEKGKGKAKIEKRGLGNRQVLGDIGNLEVLKTTDGKPISWPITRNHYAKLLANSQSNANLLLDPKAQANEQRVAQGNKNFVQLELDSTASVHKKHGLEESDEHYNERKFKKRSCRQLMTLTVEITVQSKVLHC
ncbi:uncharacterized protein LOC130945657 [Arachis stenosperma]|uniref:uncharacterized protein LOC130945657 n=1 Tax=Arachis stenosperma TaxID=217475 RepID=UPI0025AB627D|nr:uncharacterized protein LOC130945657 [Arachis stenosperma]